MGVVFKINFYKADAEKCYKELQSIGDKCTAEQVVEKAKDKNTELHKCFTWDNDIAAEKWRLHEARVLISNIVYTQDKESNEPSKVRAIYFSDTEKSYKPISLIIQNKSEYEQLLERAYSELRSFKQKYSSLNELSEIMELID